MTPPGGERRKNPPNSESPAVNRQIREGYFGFRASLQRTPGELKAARRLRYTLRVILGDPAWRNHASLRKSQLRPSAASTMCRSYRTRAPIIWVLQSLEISTSSFVRRAAK